MFTEPARAEPGDSGVGESFFSIRAMLHQKVERLDPKPLVWECAPLTAVRAS